MTMAGIVMNDAGISGIIAWLIAKLIAMGLKPIAIMDGFYLIIPLKKAPNGNNQFETHRYFLFLSKYRLNASQLLFDMDSCNLVYKKSRVHIKPATKEWSDPSAPKDSQRVRD